MNTNIDLATITVGDIANVVSAIFVIIAVIIAGLSLRNHQRVAHVDMVVKLRDRFRQLAPQRKASANFLLTELTSSGKDSIPVYLNEVMHLFEELGLFIRRRAVDELALWTLMSDYIRGYYCAAVKLGIIEKYRQDDPNYYNEFEFLYKRMLRIESRKSGANVKSLEFDVDEVKAFLNYERLQPTKV